MSAPRYFVQTFGCQMNVHDSRRIEEVLGRAGWEPSDEAALADLVLFNTCSVREKAEHKLMSVLGTARALKEARPELVIAVAGCVAQQEGEALLARAPVIDVLIGPDNIPELPALLEHAREGGPPLARTVFDLDDPRFLDATAAGGGPEITSFVTVMKGCDERCTFCIVPYTRGPERYRTSDAIVSEIAGLVDRGTREITLLGQTVNSWHEPGLAPPASGGPLSSRSEERDRESQFAELLARIAREVPALRRLRYTSPHPRHVTDALVRAHAELEVLPAHVHLPVQSGSDRVLRRMLRRYTRAHYLARARALQECRPGLTLSTDLIVGFPGETRADFEETLSLVREAGFVAAFAFKYSPRPHTPALKLGDDVSEEEKDERLARLFEVIAEQQRAHLASLVGTRTEVLFESRAEKGERRWRGRSARHEIVHVEVPDGIDLLGVINEVTIERANAHSLIGSIEGDLASLPRRSSAPAARPGRAKLPVLRRGQLAHEGS